VTVGTILKMELYELTIKEASEKLKAKEITAVELTQSCLDRINEMEPEIHAFITLTPESAFEKAKEVDEKREKGEELSDLAGIPYSIKDTYVTEGVQTTAGSKILEGYIPPYSASVVKKLDEAGAVLLGKANCDPFGFGSSTENSGYGVTHNPVDTTRIPGGSSGGSAAAVAYGGGLFSIGEDTGGSIRCPASFCGITGLKPTYGRVSRYGSIAYASSYDTVGPMTKNSEDNAMVMNEIAGVDPKDATTQPGEIPDHAARLRAPLQGKKIGIPKEYFGEGVDPEVIKVMEKAIEKYKEMGCEIVDISLPNTKYAIATYYVIGISEASSNLARIEGMRYGINNDEGDWKEKMRKIRGLGFSEEAKRRIMVGTYSLSAGYSDQYYKKAQAVRSMLREDFMQAFKEVDVILTPTMPVPALKIGQNDGDPLAMWLIDAFTVSVNPIGVPGLSVNAGYIENGDDKDLPVGMQLIAPHFEEALLYNFGHMYENYGK
jgi:aspartyl-tRNA(Asn)/glutamyl-tRNA(Gln) amidotransferase subunit A